MRKYFKHLVDELTDKHNLFAELALAWIAAMLTLLVVISLVYYFGG